MNFDDALAKKREKLRLLKAKREERRKARAASQVEKEKKSRMSVTERPPAANTFTSPSKKASASSSGASASAASTATKESSTDLLSDVDSLLSKLGAADPKPSSAAAAASAAASSSSSSSSSGGRGAGRRAGGAAGGHRHRAADIKLGSSELVEVVEIPPALVEKYDKDIQTDLEQTGLSKSSAEAEADAEEAELARVRQERRRQKEEEKRQRDEKLRKEREEAEKKKREITDLQRQEIIESPEFVNFFKRSSTFVERALTQNEQFDIVKEYGVRKDGMEQKQQSVLSNEIVFFEEVCRNRPVTSVHWAPQYEELVLASYGEKYDKLSNDPDGMVLVWSTHLAHRPEYHFQCQSAVLTAQWHPTEPHLILGGTYSGQIVLFDIRSKRTPVQYTSLSSGHVFPLYGMGLVPVNNLHQIISVSTDARLCVWNDNDLVDYSKQIELDPSSGADGGAGGAGASNASHSIVPTTVAVPSVDSAVNSIFLGSEEGNLYKVQVHNNDDVGITNTIEAHAAPISAVKFHNAHKSSASNSHVSGLFLTSSFDWTVKLWNASTGRQMYTFENAKDYVYDVDWCPTHPGVFAAADGSGYVDFWNLSKETDVPAQSVNLFGINDTKDEDDVDRRLEAKAATKLKWSDNGKQIAVGCSDGSLHVYDVDSELTEPAEGDNAAFFNKMRSAVDN